MPTRSRLAPAFDKALTGPIVGFIYLGALGSMFWLDLAYGIFVSFGLPWLILSYMI